MAPIEANQRDTPTLLIVVTALLIVVRVVASHFEEEGGGGRAANPPLPPPAAVHWVDAADAPARAAAASRPILYDFTADWCMPCRELDRQVYDDPALARAINEAFVPVRVLDRTTEEGRNHPTVDALQKRYGVEAFPTVVITDARGIELRRMRGFGGRKAFEQLLNASRTSH